MNLLSRIFLSLNSRSGRSGAALALLLLPVLVTFAQVGTPRNPFPREHGDAQNRGRAQNDLYFGVFDGNRDAFNPTASRFNPDPIAKESTGYDGWAFPRALPSFNDNPLAPQNLRDQISFFRQRAYFEALQTLRSYVTVADSPTGTVQTPEQNTPIPQSPRYPVIGGTAYSGANWAQVNGPSQNAINGTYHVAPAVTRANFVISATPVVPTPNDYFIWRPIVPGPVNTMKRYQIVIDLPTPDTTGTEGRISDAEYTVRYQIRTATGFLQKSRTVYLDQRSGGEQRLLNRDGSVAYFSFVSSATPGFTSQVELDDTTANEGANLSVIANQVRFVQQQDIITATPTVTPRHGGRKVAVAAAGGAGYPQNYQPQRDKIYGDLDTATPTSPTSVDIGGTYDLNSYVFINDPNDPAVTDAASPYFGLETDNISCFYQGPASLINPVGPESLAALGLTTSQQVQYGRATAEAVNNQRYTSLTTGNPTPFFSHMQVLVPRTEFVQNPEVSYRNVNGTAVRSGSTDNQRTGTSYITVGSVYSVDWLTGTPLWRFPDRTYLPANFLDQYGHTVPGSGLRNPIDATTGQPTVPGIYAYDKNGDGIIEDDEVFIAPQGNNTSGGLSAGITIERSVPVQGLVKIPKFDVNDNFANNENSNGAIGVGNLDPANPVVDAPAGRYYDRTTLAPVPVSVAYVASQNGVIYALDMNGNNDNRYFASGVDPTLPVSGGNVEDDTRLGHFRNGTTNALWTFSATTYPYRYKNNGLNGDPSLDLSTETIEQYNNRLKTHIPATQAFSAAPTIAYQKAGAGNPLTDEKRLFAGNDNACLYALDASAINSALDPVSMKTVLKALPFRKGQQPSQVATGGPGDPAVDPNDLHRGELRWWFETRGAIKASPAISQTQLDAQDSLAGQPFLQKGIYVTTLEGRVYCVDWTGPVTRSQHTAQQNYDGSITSATQLNDNYRFHNENPATNLAAADGTEGTIRPRWVYPNFYRNIADTVVRDSVNKTPADTSNVFPGVRIAEQSNLGAIYSAPVLMDFVFQPTGGTAVVKHYVVITANDNSSLGQATEGKVYLLDQAGDRRDFLSNPQKAGTNANAIVFGQPVDWYLPHQLLSIAAPTWTYRYQYDEYNGNTPNPQLRNSPLKTLTTQAIPSRRTTPTVFFGAIGAVYAVDIDPATGVFMRWRPTVNEQRTIMPVPDAPNGAVNNGQLPFAVPVNAPSNEILNPQNLPVGVNGVNAPVLPANLQARPVLARTYPLTSTDGSAVEHLTIGGGPLQDRDNTTNGATAPTVPKNPTNDPPNLATFFSEPLAVAGIANVFDLTGQFVNQNINDPLTTTRGSLNPGTQDANYPGTYADPPVNTTQDSSFQYPTLFATTNGGTMIEISTNLEGEQRSFTDPVTTTFVNGESANVGWALTTNPSRFNNYHILQARLGGAIGGPGGVSVVTNAYYPALDPTYRNTVAKTAGGVPTDPSYLYPTYPANQPNTGTPNPGLFSPTSLIVGSLANGGVAAVAPSRDTGSTGFPLDLNGLFYDKSFAVDPYNIAAFSGRSPNFNGDGRVRLPAYSGIGSQGGPGGIPSLFTNELPDGGKATNPLNPNASPLIDRSGATIDPRIATLPNNYTSTDDINPAGRNVAWIYAPGQDGTLYGVTPFVPKGNSGTGGAGSAGEDQPSGFLDGGPTPIINSDLISTGYPRVALFDAADFNKLKAAADAGTPIRPDADGRLGNGNPKSRIAKGERDFYEWGDKVYIVVYDALANTTATGGPAPNPNPGGFFANGNSITLTLRNRTKDNVILTRNIPIEQANGKNTFYPYDPKYDPRPITRTPAELANAASLGVAFYVVDLSTNDVTFPKTPGDLIEVTATQNVTRAVNGQIVPQQTGGATGGGAVAAEILGNIIPAFSIANPIAIQGFLVDTATGNPVGFNNGGDSSNSIGPLARGADNVTGTPYASAQYVDQPANGTTQDPDKFAARYSQALANGNSILRHDLRPYTGTGANITPNPTYKSTIPGDPTYYVPVAASAGYGNHGDNASTDTGNGLHNLRILNRSNLASLVNLRVGTTDVLWRYWPGRLPNTAATAGANSTNPRKTPTGMRDDGVINPLPWEQIATENQPWLTTGITTVNPSGVTPGGNVSQDYPDISAQNSDIIRVLTASGDLTKGGGSLPAAVNNGGATNNGDFSTSLLAPVTNNIPTNLATQVAIKVPKYQPANLVAMHSLTSTYVAPSINDQASVATNGVSDVPVGTGQEGPVQLPRDNNVTGTQGPRPLSFLNGTGLNGVATAVTPFGYTTRMLVYIDTNGNGKLDLPQASVTPTTGLDRNNPGVTSSGNQKFEEAYRIVEVWMGVPADLSLEAKQSLVDLGAVPHGFGIQNGLLGYGNGAFPFSLGFLPAPLTQNYAPFYKTFTIQNTGNVNMYNLRASQRVEDVATEYSKNEALGQGIELGYFGMRSDVVDPRFGILAVGADPTAANPTALMPQVVTSLDQFLDGAWDNYLKNNADLNQQVYSPANQPLGTIYNLFYQQFAGRHTLHKPLPNAPTPTVLGLPDVPTTSLGGAAAAVNPTPTTSLVAVAVPPGTPAGIYSSKFGSNPFVIFEDHDTPATGYQPVPFLKGDGTIAAAGPLYNNQNSNPPGTKPILPVNNGRAEGTFRPRRVISRAGTTPTLEYLPYTSPTIELKMTVTESGLTGQVPDLAVPRALDNTTSIVTGLLPNIDPFPVLDPVLGSPATLVRPAATLAPAAYRSVNGRMNVYFSSNSTMIGGIRGGVTAPGSPYKLFHTHMNWDGVLGTWSANTFGQTIGDTINNTGRWFTAPAQIDVAGGSETNTSPFVLQTPGAASLFWINSTPTTGGASVSNIYYAPLDANGVPGALTPFLNPAQFDPSLRRYSPRVVVATQNVTLDNTGTENIAPPDTAIAFYHGGVPGRLALYYAAARLNADGTINGNSGQEQLLPIPAAIASASDASPVVRTIFINNQPTTIVDVYYTGISRSNLSPQIYQTRYRIIQPAGTSQSTRLVAIQLPRIYGEKLTSPGRDLFWTGASIGWSRDLNNRPLLPILSIQYRGTGNPVVITDSNKWQVDPATGLLYESYFNNGKLGIVYIDTSAGSVRFRGPGAPTQRDNIYAEYQPATYRISTDNQGLSDIGAFNIFDNQTTLLPTNANTLSNGVLRRPNNNPLYADRQWVFWQKGAAAGRASTLYYSSRRVGIDLRNPNVGDPLRQVGAGTNQNPVWETLLLGAPDNNGNQAVAVSITVNGVNVPYDVDFSLGRIYVPAVYEGLPFTVNYTATLGNAATNRTGTATRGVLGFIEEETPTTDRASGRMVPMQTSVNEGQAYAFLDSYSTSGLNRGVNSLLPGGNDPTLQSGKIWLFWSSPRGRTGLIHTGANLSDVYPSGYDVYWETLAPNFEAQSFSGLPPK